MDNTAGHAMTRLMAEQVRVRLGGKDIIADGRLEARPGRVVGLIGPNGAGKTTLLRAVLGLTPVMAGRVLLEDVDVTATPAHQRSASLAYLAQGGVVHWPLTVENLVMLGRLPHRHPWRRLGDADWRAVAQALLDTDMTAFRHRPVTTLSGGERTRALLARALAGQAPVLLADEPAAALDPYHQLTIMALFRRLADAGRAVVLVLHDLSLAARFCDDLFLMMDGRTVASGPPQAVLTADTLARVYKVRSSQPLGQGGLVLTTDDGA